MRIAKIFLVIIIVIILGYFASMIFISSKMSSSSKTTWKEMKNKDFTCSNDLIEKTERWSKLGYSRSCVKPLNGKWEAWSDGYKNIDGSYINGKEDGIWIFYNSDGSISKKIEYSLGRELNNNGITKK